MITAVVKTGSRNSGLQFVSKRRLGLETQGATISASCFNYRCYHLLRLKGFVHRKHQRNFVADFIRFKLIFIHKNDKFAF